MNILSIFISSLSIFPLFWGGEGGGLVCFLHSCPKALPILLKLCKTHSKSQPHMHHCVQEVTDTRFIPIYTQQNQKIPHTVTWQGCTEVPLQALGCKVHHTEAVLWASHQYQVMLALLCTFAMPTPVSAGVTPYLSEGTRPQDQAKQRLLLHQHPAQFSCTVSKALFTVCNSNLVSVLHCFHELFGNAWQSTSQVLRKTIFTLLTSFSFSFKNINAHSFYDSLIFSCSLPYSTEPSYNHSGMTLV